METGSAITWKYPSCILRGLLDECEHPDQRVQIEQAMQLIESQWFASGRQKEPQDLKIILEPWFSS